MCPPLRLRLLGRSVGGGGSGGAHRGARAGAGRERGVEGCSGEAGLGVEAAAVFSHSFPRSSYLLSVWLW